MAAWIQMVSVKVDRSRQIEDISYRAYKWMDSRVWVRERNQGWPLDWKKLWIRNRLQFLLQYFMICLELFNFTDLQGETWGGQKVTTQWFFYKERYGSLGLGPSISSRGQLCASFGWEGIWTLGLRLPWVTFQQPHPVSCLWTEIFRDIAATCSQRHSKTTDTRNKYRLRI